MKILSAQQIREADQYTISNEPISSLDLMERAANACFRWIVTRFPLKENKIIVFAGNGNNGGDGLVLCRLLSFSGFSVKLVLCRIASVNSADFEKNFTLLKNSKIEIDEWEHYNKKQNNFDLIIDALFGTGLNKPTDGLSAEVITHINSLKKTIISIDIPSGLFPDDNTFNSGNIVEASYTLTFQTPKLAFFMHENHKYVGNFYVLDIGLHANFLENVNTDKYFITLGTFKQYLLYRNPFQHKGSFKHACLIAGSKGKSGAAVLATKACLNSGVGLVTAVVPEFCYSIIQNSAPEAMCLTSGNEFVSDLPKSIYEFDAIGVGPGIGTQLETQKMLKLFIQQYSGKLVLDADALNILSENKTWISFLKEETILTPHPKEFERLTGKVNSAYERYLKQKEFSIKYKVIVVLKGAFTSVSLPNGKVFFNSTGNAGMAKGGSGDVLTGFITGLLARGYSPSHAAILGVYAHGLAGDMAAKKYGDEAMLSSQIIPEFCNVFKQIYS
jgi:NAD(P)H-hydrate epimerase